MKLSIIVPVYNSEKYLEKCILSVKNQSYKNWELLLIDDGSRDNSAQMIDSFANEDPRIVAIHQQNAGPGEARNKGIEVSTGDFVVFLDADDYIDKDYFSMLVRKADVADVIFIDVLQISSDEKIICKELMSKNKKMSKDKILRAQMTGKIPWGGVRKVIKRSILVDNDIRYTRHPIGEEALYSFRVLNAARIITFLDEKPVYFYVNHEGSQSKKIMEDPWGGIVDVMKEYLKTNQLYEKYANTLNAFNLTATVISIASLGKIYEGKKLEEKCENRISVCRHTIDVKYAIDFSNMMRKAIIFSLFLRKNFYNFIILCSRLRK